MPKADHADLFAWKSLVGKLIERSDEMIALVVRKARSSAYIWSQQEELESFILGLSGVAAVFLDQTEKNVC